MLKSLTRVLCVAMAITICGSTYAAKKGKPAPAPRDLAIELGTPFHDSAILQRGMKVPIWGWAKAGTKVTVEFAGQKKTATAGKDEKWTLELDPLKASSESRAMTITESTGKKEVLKDILVGEVWMCSGQSNMQWLASSCIVGRKLQKEIKERVEAGKEKQPIIREGKVTNLFSALSPRDRGVKARWSKDWGGFSAIAFAFVYEVEKELKIPVAILNCSFSTTKIQAWIPREGFAAGKDAYTKALYKQILEGDRTTPEHKAAFDAYYEELQKWAKDSAERAKAGRPVAPQPTRPGNMNGNRDSCWMGNGKITPMAPYAIRGCFWNQGYASQNEGIVYRNNLHSMVTGWRTIWKRPELPVYFHQFYAVGGGGEGLSLNSTGEMRLGTWLAHKDIPNAAMASQIDIVGGVHYYNKAVPGQRLARHALKNQYGKDIIANGPMYKDYKVQGNKLILELDHAEGLCVGQSHTVRGGFADPVPVKDAEVKLFYLAGKDRTWHKAKMTIVGNSIELTAEGLKEPCGVAYGTMGVGTRPSIYNKAMLPLTPFIFFEKKLVLSKQWELDHVTIPGSEKTVQYMHWPDEYLKVAGETRDPRSYGLQQVYRKLWLLAPQYTHNCVIQADQPIRFYGKAVPKSVVKITLAGKEQSLTMGPEQDEYEMTFPAMKASAEPKILHAVCTLDGKIAHERKITNVVIGDVWYVAAVGLREQSGPGVPRSGPASLEAWKDRNPQLRMFKSYGRRAEGMPTRFKLNASGNPISRAFARWSPTIGFTKELADKIHAKTKSPVGIVILDTPAEEIKNWVGYEGLKKVPAWKADVDQLKPMYERDPETYRNNAETYIKLWKDYWQKVAADPYFETGAMPRFPGAVKVETKATTTFNQSICAFTPGSFKGILCLTNKSMIGENGADFGPHFSLMANGWKTAFAWGKKASDPHFVYAMPSKALASNATAPKGIEGASTAIEIAKWPEIKYTSKDKTDPETKRRIRTYHLVPNEDTTKFLDAAVNAVYK